MFKCALKPCNRREIGTELRSTTFPTQRKRTDRGQTTNTEGQVLQNCQETVP